MNALLKDAILIQFRHTFCLLSAFVMSTAIAFGQGQPLHVLAFYSTNVEQDHVDFALQAIPFFQAIATKDHFEFAVTTNWRDLNPATLTQYQLILWLDDVPSAPEQRIAFQHYMEDGGAWLGFHIAGYTDSREAWPWFADFLGGVFCGNSWPPLPAKLDMDDPSHPTMKGLPASFVSPANEWYSWKPDPRHSPGIKVLLTLDSSNYPLDSRTRLLVEIFP